MIVPHKWSQILCLALPDQLAYKFSVAKHQFFVHLWGTTMQGPYNPRSLQWRHNGRNGVSNHQSRDYLLNRLFKALIKGTSKLRSTGPCEGNSPGTGKFPAQRASNAKMFLFHDVIMWIFVRQSEMWSAFWKFISYSHHHHTLCYRVIQSLTISRGS